MSQNTCQRGPLYGRRKTIRIREAYKKQFSRNQRHHLQRLKKARAFDQAIGTSRQSDTATLGRHVNTPAKCSCWMCGNPRRYFDEKSRQERIQDEKFDADSAMMGVVNFDERTL
jgi:hypothetical protein